jgi:hypothetical protein
MPGTYPAPAPTLSGDLETISRFLQSPTQIRRRLRDYTDLRFVSDQILTQRMRSSGGAVLYEMSEPFVTDRAVESVSPGAEYPFANLPVGTGAIASVAKWGQKVRLTDEEIARNVYAGQAVDRNLRKVVNSVIKQVDGVTMSAVASAVTQYVQAGGGSLIATQWAASSGVKMLYDILMAKAKVVGLNLGYNPDTLLVGDTAYALMMSDTVITNALRREDSTNPVYTGKIERIGGLTIVVGGSQNAVDPYVLDSTQLGGMADEMDGAPGYAMDQLAVQVKSIRKDDNDAFDLQGRRKTVPVVQEPGAGCKIAQAITAS